LQACVSVADVEELVRAIDSGRPRHRKAAPRAPRRGAHRPPGAGAGASGKAFIGKLQDFFYGEVMKPARLGRAYIPHNRNVIVVANHSSHLDMGFVRHALGKYGEDVVSLAAQDYFFEKYRQAAFFENLTNLKAIDRKASLRQAIRRRATSSSAARRCSCSRRGRGARAARSRSSSPSWGHLALVHGVDILPGVPRGTHAAMPQGRGRADEARDCRPHRTAARAWPICAG
jgi:long-chain acyl-CoA synthetase